MSKTIKNEQFWTKNKQKCRDFDQKRLSKSENRAKNQDFMFKTIKNEPFWCQKPSKISKSWPKNINFMSKTIKNIKIATKNSKKWSKNTRFYVKNHQKVTKLRDSTPPRARARTRGKSAFLRILIASFSSPTHGVGKKKAKNACFSSWDEVIFFLCDSKLGGPKIKKSDQNWHFLGTFGPFWVPRDPFWDPPGTPPPGGHFWSILALFEPKMTQKNTFLPQNSKKWWKTTKKWQKSVNFDAFWVKKWQKYAKKASKTSKNQAKMTKKSPKRAKLKQKIKISCQKPPKMSNFEQKTSKKASKTNKNQAKTAKKHLFLTQKSSKNDHFFVFFCPLRTPSRKPPPFWPPKSNTNKWELRGSKSRFLDPKKGSFSGHFHQFLG